MAILTDTNVLLRLLQPHHPHCPIAEQAISVLRAQNQILSVVTQNLIELWAVATRPIGQNGLGLTAENAVKELDHIKQFWTLLPELPLFEEWKHLVTTYRLSGKNTHDAHLVAAMRVHRVDTILTFNAGDFIRYKGITVLHPDRVA